MKRIASKYRNDLERIKNNITEAYECNHDNVISFNEFRKMIFDTSITDTDKATLDATKKPELETNIGEAFLSRLYGEFSKQEPSFECGSSFGTPPDPQMVSVVEGHLRHAYDEAARSSVIYETYKASTSGGWSVFRLYTDYACDSGPGAFDYVIKWEKVYDETMCGFDPMAVLPHKGDGKYCFQAYPMRREDFEEQYPNVNISDIKFSRNIGDFTWSYKFEGDEVLLLAEYYEKKVKKKKIVKLSTGEVMLMDDYKRFSEWHNTQGFIEQAPKIVSERMTDLVTICRYLVIETKIIEYSETSYPCFPLIWVDGNSITLKDNSSGVTKFKTRPYLYHARGIQKLKNFAVQCLANELENMVQHKFMVPQEALPDSEDYLKAWTNYQLSAVLVHKAFKDNNPDMPLPPPQPVPRVPIPPEIMNAYQVSDQTLQAILGSYDASLGINDNQLSGVAIVEGATQSNSAAMPYIVGIMHALNRVAEFYVKMIPKIYRTSRTLPVIKPDGKKDYIPINQQGGIELDYHENALQVQVKAGVNFAIQRQRTLNTIGQWMQSSQTFADFINSKCLTMLIDNFEIDGKDQMKVLAEQYMQELQQQKQMQMQMAQQQAQNNPMMIKAKTEQAKLQHQIQQSQMDNQLEFAKIQVANKDSDNERMRIMMEAKQGHVGNIVAMEKAQTEKTVHAMDFALEEMKHHHALIKSIADHHHKMTVAKQKPAVRH